jgi:hypothetical protein
VRESSLFKKISDLAEAGGGAGAEGIGIGLTVNDLGIGSAALALGIEGLALSGVVAEVFPALGAGGRGSHRRRTGSRSGLGRR